MNTRSKEKAMSAKNSDIDFGEQLLAKRSSQVQGGAARAAVLGINDGLVSTVCLVLAVAAATGGGQDAVLLAGFAGLIAGAFSMAAGEWISVKAQVELFEGILCDLHNLAKKNMHLLKVTLKKSYVDKGLSSQTANRAVEDLTADSAHFTGTYALQVLGVNPGELGRPWVAAVSSFGLFTLGSAAALSPWVLYEGALAVFLSVSVTAIFSLGVGGYIARTSGKKIWYGAIRQFMIVLLASVVTYGVGYIFGVATA